MTPNRVKTRILQILGVVIHRIWCGICSISIRIAPADILCQKSIDSGHLKRENRNFVDFWSQCGGVPPRIALSMKVAACACHRPDCDAVITFKTEPPIHFVSLVPRSSLPEIVNGFKRNQDTILHWLQGSGYVILRWTSVDFEQDWSCLQPPAGIYCFPGPLKRDNTSSNFLSPKRRLSSLLL